MKVFYCKKFLSGFKTACAVVPAESPSDAAIALSEQLEKMGYRQFISAFDMTEIDRVAFIHQGDAE